MVNKPQTAKGYPPTQVLLVRATCLYVATKLGDLLDEIVVVGGLVPSLLIDQDVLEADEDRHVGTLDLDIGLALALLDRKRYQELTERLRQADFKQDKNERGEPTHQRWSIEGPPKVTVDFLIPPSRPTDKGGDLRHIEGDFAAIISPGLQLAFRDRERVTISGNTIRAEKASRDMWVCGPGAYIAMKALALRLRGENKDAYDLVYLLQHYGVGVGEVAARLSPLLSEPEAAQAVGFLKEDFEELDSIGPRRFAEFVRGKQDDALKADARAVVLDLLQECEGGVPPPQA